MKTGMNAAGAEQRPMTLRLASALFEIETTEPAARSRLVLKIVCVLFAVLRYGRSSPSSTSLPSRKAAWSSKRM